MFYTHGEFISPGISLGSGDTGVGSRNFNRTLLVLNELLRERIDSNRHNSCKGPKLQSNTGFR